MSTPLDFEFMASGVQVDVQCPHRFLSLDAEGTEKTWLELELYNIGYLVFHVFSVVLGCLSLRNRIGERSPWDPMIPAMAHLTD